MNIRICFFVTLFCLSMRLFAQDCDIALSSIVKQSQTYDTPVEVTNYVTGRLQTLTSDHGNLGAIHNDHFALLFEYNVVEKQVVDGAPRKIIYNIDANFSIIDLKSQIVYTSCDKKLKGIGDNEQKALLNTFSRINNADMQLKEFLRQGKDKIIDYYNNNYNHIISESKALASMRNYDQAIYNLLMIPRCCVGYEETVLALTEIFQQFVNQHCNENLAQARAAWISSPNREGAISASVFLSEIYPDASCYEEAKELAQEIKKQMGNELKFVMKQWDDSMSLEQQRIDAMREIGIAYANAHSTSHVTTQK